MHNLPTGCPLWQSVGGQRAWSDEMHMLSKIEFWTHIADWRLTVAGSNNQNRPEPDRPPPLAHEVAAAEAKLEAKVQRYLEAPENTT